MRRNAVLLMFVWLAVLAGGCATGGPEHDLAAELTRRQVNRERSMELYFSGLEAFEAGKLDRAKEILSEAVAVNDRNTYAWMALGIVQRDLENLFDAAAAFHNASRLEPRRYEPHYNIAVILESVGRYSKAIKEYEAAHRLAPDQLEVMENLARCYLRNNENLGKSKELIDRALISETRPDWRSWLIEQSRRLEFRRLQTPQLTKPNSRELSADRDYQ